MRRLFRCSQLTIVTLGACLLTALCLQTTGIAALMKSDLPRAAALAPSDPRVELDLARSLFVQQQGLTSATSLRLALAAAPAAPFSLEPVLLSGAAAAMSGEADRAEALLVEARRRDPRSALVRAHLLDLYARTGRISEAAVELVALSRLVPEAAGELFVPQLSYLAQVAGSPDQLAPGLKAAPEVRGALLAHLVQQGAIPDLVLKIAQNSKTAETDAADKAWQRPLVERLVKAGAVEDAYRLWHRFHFSDRSAQQSLLRDGSFRKPLQPAPFGWQLTQGSQGVAEPAEGQGLEISYYGRQSVELARQLLVLAPGTYRFSVALSGAPQPRSGAISWRLACLGGSELLNLPLSDAAIRSNRFASDLVVPPGCRGQWLVLRAEPPHLARPESFKISGLAIRRIA